MTDDIYKKIRLKKQDFDVIESVNADGESETIGILQDSLAVARTGKVKSISVVLNLDDGSHYVDFHGECGSLIEGIDILDYKVSKTVLA